VKACTGIGAVVATCECLIETEADGTCPARTVAELDGSKDEANMWQDEEGTRRPALAAPANCCQFKSTLPLGIECMDKGACLCVSFRVVWQLV
jgi:hypothetical protein